MFHYFSYVNDKYTTCFVELDSSFFCKRIIHISNKKITTSYIDYLNHPFPFPEESFKNRLQELKKILKDEFEILWHQKDEDFVNIKTVYKEANLYTKEDK